MDHKNRCPYCHKKTPNYNDLNTYLICRACAARGATLSKPPRGLEYNLDGLPVRQVVKEEVNDLRYKLTMIAGFLKIAPDAPVTEFLDAILERERPTHRIRLLLEDNDKYELFGSEAKELLEEVIAPVEELENMEEE